MSFSQFCKMVRENEWTVDEIRCNVQPTEEILEAMEVVGLDKWEEYVTRMTN